MREIILTPTGNGKEMTILFLNEKNTICDYELKHICDEAKEGKVEGETFDLFPEGDGGGIWERII